MRSGHAEPAQDRIVLRYQVPKETELSLKVYTIAGRLAATLAQGSRKPGTYRLVWGCKDNRQREFAAEVYFLALDADGRRINRKVVLTGQR